MRAPPGLNEAVKFPVTGGTVLFAILVSVAWWLKLLDVGPLMADVHVRQWQLWRLLTSALPHLNMIHLAFDVYWTWVFGTLIEMTLGHIVTFLIFALLAAGSSAAQYAMVTGGAGLSGVAYGLFGMLWALSGRDRRFADVIDQQTIRLFVVWFFICIVITHMGMPIGNVAHGFGFVLGFLLGWTISGRRSEIVAGSLATTVLLAASLLAATLYRPWVNIAHDGYGEAKVGYEALKAGRNEEAVRWFRDAARINPADPVVWYDMGLAEIELNDPLDAKADFHRAAVLEPSNKDYVAADKQTDSN
jgi:membrane associated rhomboid family serine protease